MAIRQLRQDEDAILRKKCKEVTEIDKAITFLDVCNNELYKSFH